jgi:hypothetical protein
MRLKENWIYPAELLSCKQAVEKGSPALLRSIASLQRIGKYTSAEPVLSGAEGSISCAPRI